MLDTHFIRGGGGEGGREGVSYAGVPLELIKITGHWKSKSNAVSLYLTVPLNIRLHTSNLLIKHIL